MKRIIASMRQRKRSAGPFGYEMGQKIEGEPDGIRRDGTYYKLITQNVPAPFTTLHLTYTPNAGLCGIGALVATDDYEAQFSKLREMLADKYGEPIVDSDRDLSWFDVNVDNIAMLILRKEPTYKSETLILICQFTNLGDCQAEATAIRQEKRSAGPFGYEMGQKIEGEPDITDLDGLSHKTIIHGAPAPFKALHLTYTPNAGLCGIMASMATDDYEAQFPKLLGALTDKYGEPVLDSDGDLRWHDVNVDNIAAITLPKEPASESITPLTYIFNNFGDCIAEAKAMLEKDELRDLL